MGKDEAAAYSELTVHCSSAGAPWRDLVRLERGRKALFGVELALLWTSVVVAHSDAVLDDRVDDGRLRTTALRAGDAVIYPQGACLYVSTVQPVETTAVQLAPGVLLAVADALGASPAVMSEGAVRDPQIEAITSLLETEARSGCPGGRLYAEHLAYAFAAHLVQRYGRRRNAVPASQRLRKSKLAAVLEYIHAHPGSELSVKALARAAQLSPFHFSRLFKTSTGFTPHQYVQQWRIAEAKRLLRHSRLELAEIATRLGFGDQSHFTACFRQLVGETPKRWRERT